MGAMGAGVARLLLGQLGSGAASPALWRSRRLWLCEPAVDASLPVSPPAMSGRQAAVMKVSS